MAELEDAHWYVDTIALFYFAHVRLLILRLQPSIIARVLHFRLSHTTTTAKSGQFFTGCLLPRWSFLTVHLNILIPESLLLMCKNELLLSLPMANNTLYCRGEYGLGTLANELSLGCDCLGQIHYLVSRDFSHHAREVIVLP